MIEIVQGREALLRLTGNIGTNLGRIALLVPGHIAAAQVADGRMPAGYSARDSAGESRQEQIAYTSDAADGAIMLALASSRPSAGGASRIQRIPGKHVSVDLLARNPGKLQGAKGIVHVVDSEGWEPSGIIDDAMPAAIYTRSGPPVPVLGTAIVNVRDLDGFVRFADDPGATYFQQ